MKKFRPYNLGYITLYLLVLLSAAGAVHSIITMIGSQASDDSMNQMLNMWSLFIVPFALLYVNMYIRTMVEINAGNVRLARPVLITPKPGEKRAMILFRQGVNDYKLIQRHFELSQLKTYGYVEAFNFKTEDMSGARTKGKWFPVHEVAFIMQDGRNCRLNAAIYSEKQLTEMIGMIKEQSGIAPVGELAKLFPDL